MLAAAAKIVVVGEAGGELKVEMGEEGALLVLLLVRMEVLWSEVETRLGELLRSY